jgi:hypothetical protein
MCRRSGDKNTGGNSNGGGTDNNQQSTKSGGGNGNRNSNNDRDEDDDENKGNGGGGSSGGSLVTVRCYVLSTLVLIFKYMSLSIKINSISSSDQLNFTKRSESVNCVFHRA